MNRLTPFPQFPGSELVPPETLDGLVQMGLEVSAEGVHQARQLVRRSWLLAKPFR